MEGIAGIKKKSVSHCPKNVSLKFSGLWPTAFWNLSYRTFIFSSQCFKNLYNDLTADLSDFLNLYFLDFKVALDALWSKSPKMSIFPTNVTVCCIQLVSSFYWKLQQLAWFSILVVFLTKDQNKLSLLNFWSGLFPNSLCTLQREIRYCFLRIFIN